MDHWGEVLILSLDVVVFTIVSKLYSRYNHTINIIEKAQRLGINPNVSELSEDAKKYVIIQGEVKALGQPIRSLNSHEVTGVVQRLTIKEHAIARNASGFWADQKKVIQEAYNVVRFLVERGPLKVEVLDPLSAEMLDLDTVHDKFESSSLGLMDHVVGFFNGVRQRGVETTEELLKEGSVLTVIGELSQDGELLQISPPASGSPYFLTSLPVTSLVRRIEEQRNTFKWLSILFSGIGISVLAYIARKWWVSRQARIKDELEKKKLERTRKERRRNVRDTEILEENQTCVICRVNPKEIILLPCGHVSLCEDCAENISSTCPVCRETISSKNAAFIS